MAWVYELPFGRGRPFGTDLTRRDPVSWLSGWSIQGSFTAHTGFPLTPTSSVSSNVGRQDTNRADRLCDGNLERRCGVQSIAGLIQAAFANHVFGRFGNSGNGVITGPGLNTSDLTLMKNTYIRSGTGSR